MERRRRSEQALVQVIAECYVRGISTRRVDGLVKTLGIDGISRSQVSAMAKSLDPMVEAFRNRPLDGGPYRYVWVGALVQKCRESGRIVNVALVCATGVNHEGQREILGMDVIRRRTVPRGRPSCARWWHAGSAASSWSSPTTTRASHRRSAPCS